MSDTPVFEHRFGVSLLSKDRNRKAYNEELLVDKKTGELLVRTPEGDIVSFNSASRKEHVLNEFRTRANNLGIYGDYYDIIFNLDDDDDNKHTTLPYIIPVGENQLNSNAEITFSQSSNIRKFKRFSLYLDLYSYRYDLSANSTDESLITFTNEAFSPKVTIDFICNFTDGTTGSFSLTNYPYVINEKVYKLSDFNLPIDKEISSVKITNFTLLNVYSNKFGEAISKNENQEFRSILYNFLILFENY